MNKHTYEIGDYVVCTDQIKPDPYSGLVARVLEVRPRNSFRYDFLVELHDPELGRESLPVDSKEIRPATQEEILVYKLTL